MHLCRRQLGLMALSLVVMLGFLDQAEVEATSATVQKLARLMEQRTEAFDRAFSGGRKQNAIKAMRFLLADPNRDGDQGDGIFGVYDSAVTMLAKKALFRFEMPPIPTTGTFTAATTALKPSRPITSASGLVDVAATEPAPR